MKAKDLRALSPDELRTKIKDLREELFRIKFQHSIQQLENTARFPVVKRDIARIETVLREK
jgi:large subunit ribosomal protein L29